ncbi:major prion protein [Mantella aurantiaca]
MSNTFWTCLVLVSLCLLLTEASKKGGKSKTGGWGSSGSSRNPSYPGNTGNTGSNWNPSHGNRGGQNPAYPGNTGGGYNPHYPNNPGTNWNQGGGYNYNPGGSNYNKQWKPDKKKTNMKMVAGAAAAGVVGGFVLGSAMSNMRYNFDNDMEHRYYNSYRNQMPNQVYKPQYQGNPYVPEDRFVTDCFNTTMTEYVIKPNEGKNTTEINDTEIKVKSTIIRQMCITEYKRSPEYYAYNSGMKMLFSLSLIFFIPLFVYFVVQ